MAATSIGALALPVGNPVHIGSDANVQQIASWRYSNACAWNGSGWRVDAGNGRIVACRPNRPGRNWNWHSEGNRHGWYDSRQRTWHHNNW